MKKQNWFIVLFMIWCVVCALWYLFGVKGVMSTDPKYFNPQIRLLAIIEILAMLLVACLLGYAIAWWLREEKIEIVLFRASEELKRQDDQWKEKHQSEIGASQQKAQELTSERTKLQRRLTEAEDEASSVREEILAIQTQLQQTDSETGTLRYRIRQLEFQSKELEETNYKLQRELESLHGAKGKVSDHPFVRPVEFGEKDDLTKIKGIGPFIEKRLNMIGIYTFRQLSELTPELVERVGAAIEFFPQRIARDNWVGQAQKFN